MSAGSVQQLSVAALVAMLGCSSAGPAPAPAPAASAAQPRSTASAPATTLAAPSSASPLPSSNPPARLGVHLVHFKAETPEPRLLVEPVESARPSIERCVEVAAKRGPVTGWLVVEGTFTAATSAEPRARGHIDSLVVRAEGNASSVSACVQAAFAGLSIAEPPPKPAGFSLWLAIAEPRPDLDLKDPFEALIRGEDGRCIGRESSTCPANKVCAPARERDVACPTLDGTPARPAPSEAEKRLDLGVSGGKTGQGSERLSLFRERGQCAALKVRVDIMVDPPKETREAVDIPCAAFEKTLKLAQSRLLGRRPRGDDRVLHAVGKTVSYLQAGKGGAPIVTELRWTGPDAADEAFSLVASEAAKAVEGRGKLQLSRIRP
ncbi:MAG: hypothetical protein JNL21_10105 [Myxococcales bacterium]|nr:hypothetical protein [Myxococcales bacterium]